MPAGTVGHDNNENMTTSTGQQEGRTNRAYYASACRNRCVLHVLLQLHASHISQQSACCSIDRTLAALSNQTLHVQTYVRMQSLTLHAWGWWSSHARRGSVPGGWRPTHPWGHHARGWGAHAWRPKHARRGRATWETTATHSKQPQHKHKITAAGVSTHNSSLIQDGLQVARRGRTNWDTTSGSTQPHDSSRSMQ